MRVGFPHWGAFLALLSCTLKDPWLQLQGVVLLESQSPSPLFLAHPFTGASPELQRGGGGGRGTNPGSAKGGRRR